MQCWIGGRLAEAIHPERVKMDQRQPIPEERAKIAAAQTQDRSWHLGPSRCCTNEQFAKCKDHDAAAQCWVQVSATALGGTGIPEPRRFSLLTMT